MDESLLDTPIDFASSQKGISLGAGAFMVCDQSVSPVAFLRELLHFFAVESCGKCTPCREGNYWMQSVIERVRSDEGKPEDVELLKNVATQMQNKCLCALGEFATMAVVTGIERFPQDFKLPVRK